MAGGGREPDFSFPLLPPTLLELFILLDEERVLTTFSHLGLYLRNSRPGQLCPVICTRGC